MTRTRFAKLWMTGAALLAVSTFNGASADEAKSKAKPDAKDKTQALAEKDVPTYNLLDAMRDGLVDVDAEGKGDGRMTVSVTNTTNRQLRVVLPPGLVAQGATGQMGGMGGMGGGMGGMGGGMGGGMMGGMGGGMGGGMRGGMGGGMMGGMGGGVMPARMGMMMLGRMIMMLCGDYDSWDQRSLMMGMMMGGMGGMGGGMGGGMMGGMGGGMGGMGGGMRSVPPTGLPFADVKPGRTRKLPTRLVSLSAPADDGGVRLPAEGEKLQLGDISQINPDPRVQTALKRLAADKANNRIAQMVMWRVALGLEWDVIAQLAQKWGNPYELTIAQEFVDRLDTLSNEETGALLFQVDAVDAKNQALADELTTALKDKPILGLWARQGVPVEPLGPAVACKVRLNEKDAVVLVGSSNAKADAWVPYGKFTVPVARKDGKLDAAKFSDDLAEGVLNRLVRAQLAKGPRVKGKETFKIRIDNASPLILNGLAVVGADATAVDQPKELAGISVSPRRSMTVPATDEVVKALGLKKGIRIYAADLSDL